MAAITYFDTITHPYIYLIIFLLLEKVNATIINLGVNQIQSRITAESLAMSNLQSVPLSNISFSVSPKNISFNGKSKFNCFLLNLFLSLVLLKY